MTGLIGASVSVFSGAVRQPPRVSSWNIERVDYLRVGPYDAAPRVRSGVMFCPQCRDRFPDGSATCPRDGALLLEPVARPLASGPVPLTQAVKIADRVCEILGGMHAAGRVHASISAESVMIRHVGGELTVDLVETSRATAPAASYLAPERARGAAPNPSTDLYAVGVLLFHMIAGHLPEGGRAPSLATLDLQDVPVELDAIVRSMMARDPADRPHHVEAVRAQIENLELDSTVMGHRLVQLRAAARASLDPVSAAPTDPSSVPPSSARPRPPADANTDPDDTNEVPVPPKMRAALPRGPMGRAAGEPGIDPFADTLIRARSELDLDGTAETQLRIDPEIVKAAKASSVARAVPPPEPDSDDATRLDFAPGLLQRPSISAAARPSDPASIARHETSSRAVKRRSVPVPALVMLGLALALVAVAIVLLVT